MVSFQQPGMIITDRSFTVPLDHAQPGGPAIELFAREVAAPGREADSLAWLLFLRGGPGFGAPRPAGDGGWLERALKDYRVLLLDQRGTARSSPANRRTLDGLTPQQQADYLALFRADSIVADAELIRPQVTGGGPSRRRVSARPCSPAGCPALTRTPTTCTGRPIRRWPS